MFSIKRVLLVIVLGLSSINMTQAATIGFSSADSLVRVGEIFSIDIIGIDFPELAGGEIDFTFNNAVVDVDSVTVDSYWDFLPAGGSKTASGEWSLIGFDVWSSLPATGTMTIATINLTALAVGTSSLDFGYTFFADSTLTGELFPTLASANITVTTVPLPAAVWLMLSGMLSVFGLSSYRRRKSNA